MDSEWWDDGEWSDDELLFDVAEAQWIGSELQRPHPGMVGSLVPGRYPAYARLMHPAERQIGDVTVELFRWSDVARICGTAAHAEMQWSAITGREDRSDWAPWNVGPARVDWVPRSVMKSLATVIADSTHADVGYFAFWEGNSTLDGIRRYPTAQIGGYRYFLVRGETARVCDRLHGLRPNMWWTADRSAFVASNFDLDSTYIGADRKTVRNLLLDNRIEVWPAEAEQGITVLDDRVNHRIGPVDVRGRF